MTRSIAIPLADGTLGWLHAGPTSKLPEGYSLIRCAAEIPTPAARIGYDIGTSDFSVFNPDILEQSVPYIIRDLHNGRPLYAGCMGGTGRTGTILAILVGQHPAFTGDMAVAYVRQHYKAHAVETKEQWEQVREFSDRDPLPDLRKLDTPASLKAEPTAPQTWWQRLFNRG